MSIADVAQRVKKQQQQKIAQCHNGALFCSLRFFFLRTHLTFLDTHFSPKFACNHNNIDLGSFVSSFLFAIFPFLCCCSCCCRCFALRDFSLFACITLFAGFFCSYFGGIYAIYSFSFALCTIAYQSAFKWMPQNVCLLCAMRCDAECVAIS